MRLRGVRDASFYFIAPATMTPSGNDFLVPEWISHSLTHSLIHSPPGQPELLDDDGLVDVPGVVHLQVELHVPHHPVDVAREVTVDPVWISEV